MKKIFLLTNLLIAFTAFSEEAAKSPTAFAAEAAAKEVGRVIGRSIGQDVLNQMTHDDQRAVLDRARAATRGDMLARYSYDQSPYFNTLYGYISVIRQGNTQQGQLCLEYEIDLVVRVNRYFMHTILCEQFDGSWRETSAAYVTFPVRTYPDPGNGGWLPPVR